MEVIHQIYIPIKAFQSNQLDQIIEGNIESVNLFLHFFNEDQLLEDALYSYYLELYYISVRDGNFPQFFQQLQQNPKIQQYLVQGLNAIQAENHLDLFKQVIEVLKSLNQEQINQFLSGDYFTDQQADLIFLNQFKSLFLKIDQGENLRELNGIWLRNHPKLTALTYKQYLDLLMRLVEK